MLVNKKFILYVSHPALQHAIEVPVYASSLDEATEIAEFEYEAEGFVVERIRPASSKS